MSYDNYEDFSFDTSEIKPDEKFDLIPAGAIAEGYLKDVEITHSRAGDLMVKLTVKIVGGDYDNRLVWDNAMLAGKGKDMGMRKLTQILSALGEPTNYITIPIIKALQGRQFAFEIGVNKPKDGYDAKNQVKNFFALEGVVPSIAPHNLTAKALVNGVPTKVPGFEAAPGTPAPRPAAPKPAAPKPASRPAATASANPWE